MFTWSALRDGRPAVMGILNVTPDSFSDGGRYLDPDAAVARGVELVAAGADLVDIGGESTRPGAERVSERDELARVVPVVARLAAAVDVPISVDTTKAAVAMAAVDAGAAVVNDVSAGRADPGMLSVVAGARCGYVVMHMQGEPRTMQRAPRYDDVVGEVCSFLTERIRAALAVGIDPEAVCADPGIGFGKSAAHNLELLAGLRTVIDEVKVPVMVGASRKAFIGATIDAAGARRPPLGPSERDDGTLATVVWALEAGASVVRVHDVRAAVEARSLLELMAEVVA